MLELDYMVLPEDLKEKAFVKDAVLFQIVDHESPALKGILGDSGRKLAKAGMKWLFKRELAMKLIELGVAVPL